mmetsp:Transcript_49625/g.99864  ORF Transcript_49625/g.99864 Transcript_49625/m.99864 type:complete len:263 (-) Transcript_49625:251-1039(-)
MGFWRGPRGGRRSRRRRVEAGRANVSMYGPTPTVVLATATGVVTAAAAAAACSTTATVTTPTIFIRRLHLGRPIFLPPILLGCHHPLLRYHHRRCCNCISEGYCNCNRLCVRQQRRRRRRGEKGGVSFSFGGDHMCEGQTRCSPRHHVCFGALEGAHAAPIQPLQLGQAAQQKAPVPRRRVQAITPQTVPLRHLLFSSSKGTAAPYCGTGPTTTGAVTVVVTLTAAAVEPTLAMPLTAATAALARVLFTASGSRGQRGGPLP